MREKLIYLILLGCCLLPFCTTAQTPDKPYWLSINVGHQEYKGDLGNEFFKFGIGDDWAFGASVERYLSPSFDLLLAFNIGVLDSEKEFQDRVEFFTNTYIKTALQARFNFANGGILPQDSGVQPFITAGIGLTSYTNGKRDVLNRGVRPDVPTGSATTIPMGLGADIPLGDNISLYAQSTYHRIFAEGFDGRDKIDNRDHDDYIIHSIGVKFSLWTTQKDQDKDGVPDERDACPAEKGPGISSGCPDQDEDGIIDRNDKCPQAAGPDYTGGCPDSDQDGVENSIDKCPNIAGDSNSEGCPDDDGDGVMNEIDQCPQVTGSKTANGCPDSDNDGVTNEMDACPETAGNVNSGGCPDSDGDGVNDSEDQCPNQAGPTGNDGCPVKVADAIQEELADIAQNIRFNIGTDTLDTSSHRYLDRLAEIMQDDANLNLVIDAYTDSEGNAAYNLELSRNRANAVKQYLVDQGINEERLRASGYGEILPIAPNDTEEGRAKNRRIELRLTYF